MSRSENTTPWRLWSAHGLSYDSPIKCYLTHHKSRTKEYRKIRHRKGRRVARADLRRGIEPEPYRPRNSVLWDAI